MFKNIAVIAALAVIAAYACGCADVNRAAYGAGHAGGKVMTVPRSVAQGGTDAYVDSRTNNANPYQR